MPLSLSWVPAAGVLGAPSPPFLAGASLVSYRDVSALFSGGSGGIGLGYYGPDLAAAYVLGVAGVSLAARRFDAAVGRPVRPAPNPAALPAKMVVVGSNR